MVVSLVVFLHAVIVVVQFLAISATVKLIRITQQWTWLAIGAGVGLATIRTIHPMYKYFAGIGQLPSIERTLISLTITVLLFISLYYAVPKFRELLTQASSSKENLRRLRTLMGNLPGIAYRCSNDRNWTMEFISDGCVELTGYTSSHLVNNTRLSFADLIHKDDKDRVWREVQAAVDEGRKFQLTYRIHTASGEERWVWEQGCGVCSNGGSTPDSLEGFITDITERKRAELEQAESEARFRQITENLRDVFWLTDWAERKVVYVSPAYKDVWGRDCQSLYDEPKSWRDVLHPEDRDRVVEAFEHSCPEKPFDIEYRIIRGDGIVRWIHDRAIPIMRSDGTIYRMAGFSEDITARKEAEVLIRENEMRLRLMVEQMPAILWTVDENLRINSSMGAGLNGLGLKPNELTGQTLTEFFGTDDEEFLPLAMHRRALAGECVAYDIEWAGRNYKVVLEPRRAAGGRVEGAIGAALDVTDQVKVTKLLSESELRFHGAFVHAPIGIALVGTNGRFLKVNHRLCEMVGYSEAELIELTFQQITHVDDLRSGMEALTKFMQGNRDVYRVEKRYVHKDGQAVWIDLSVSPVRDTEGRVQYFVSQIQNVTDRKNAERELKKSEQRFRSAFDNAPIGEALIDRDNHILKVNRRLCEMLGYEERELLEKSFDSIAHPEDVEQCRRVFDSFRAGETRYVELKKRYLHRNSSIVWTEVTGSAVSADDGQPLYFVVQIKDITQQVAAEEAKREIDELFRGSFENAPIGITINSADGSIVRANPRVCEMLGYSEAELKLLSFQQITHPDDLPTDVAAYAEFMRDERNHFFFEKRYMHKRGHPVWIHLSVSAVRDENRVLQYFVTQIQDITERKRAEDELRQSEEKYRTLTEAAKDSIFVIDGEDRIVFVNGFGASQFAMSPEQMIGKRRAELFPPSIAARQEKNIRRVFETGELVKADEQTPFPGGDRWLHTQLAPLHDAKGHVQAVMGIARDITDRRLAEEALKRSEEFNRRIIEAIPGGVVHVSRDGRIVNSNAEGARLMGMGIDQLTEKSLTDFGPTTIWEDGSPCPPEEYPESKAIQTGESQSAVTIGVRRPDGDICWAIYRAVPTRDPLSGEVTGAVVTFLDITERKQAEELRLQRDMAEASNRAKNAFLANVSHEIRTPLMSILGAAETLRGRQRTIDSRVDYVDMILRNGSHLLALMNDLLDWASIEAGKLEVHPLECSFTELLADVQAVIGPLHAKPGITLSFEYTTSVPVRIWTDPIRLKQAVINLVSNALKYTDQGMVTVTISVEETKSQPWASFAVEDTGTGIKDGDLERIFQAFSRADLRPHQVKSGAGLGLPLTETIARALGGSLEVQSEWGQGSIFTLVVPCGEVKNQEWTTLSGTVIPSKGQVLSSLPWPTHSPHGSILLAEDDPDVRLLVVGSLMRAGAEVVAVDNGRDAVELATQREFDLILMDVRMPIMTGMEAVAEMRSRGIIAPIIAMTASTAQTELEMLMRSGFDDLWPKPISMERLVESAMVYLPEALLAGEPKSAPIHDVSNSLDDMRMLQVIDEFKRTLPARLQRIEDAVSSNDQSETREALHQLTGTAGTMGMEELSDEAARLLNMIRVDGMPVGTNDLARIREIVSGLLVETA